MYAERRSSIPGAVLWRATARTGARVLPDGCMDLLWWNDEIVIAGPDTRAHVGTGASQILGLRLPPAVAPALLGVPASELLDQRVPLAAFWPALVVRRMTDTIGTAGDPGSQLDAIAGVLVRERPPDPAMTDIARWLEAGRSVAEVSQRAGYSERQLHRRATAAYGYGAKTLARILRFGQALTLARAGTPLASTAARVGYADQAHLAREVKALAGVSASELIQ